MIGISAAVLVFLVAAAVCWHQGGDSVTLGALFILGGAVVSAISAHLGRVESARRDGENTKKIDATVEKIVENTELTKEIPAKVKEETVKVSEKVDKATEEILKSQK